MGAFQRPIAVLSEDQLARFEHAEMGMLALTDQVAMLRLIRTELEAAETLSYAEIPNGVNAAVLSGVFDRDLEAVLERMVEYGPNVANPKDERASIAAVIQSLRDIVIERVRPLVRPDTSQAEEMLNAAQVTLREAESKIEALQRQHDSIIAGLNEQHEELSRQQAAIAVESAVTVAADLSPHYAKQGKDHGEAAGRLLVASVVVGCAFAVATVLALFVFPPDYTAAGSSEQWIEFVRGAVGRLTLLSLVAVALSFCLRNYRVNRHLEVVNKRRENALNTFGLLQAAVTTDDARNVVVAELVRSVFGSEETGYLTGQTDRTVIEAPGGSGILSAMTAASRPPGQ